MSMSAVSVLILVAGALFFFVTGWVRMEVVALLVLAVLAVGGLVTLDQALAGFASPAVVTVWSMFILSAALSKTGVAHLMGRPLHRFAKGGEAGLMLALMLAASLLSVFINTVTVAALMLPATMELARRTGRAPSRLLMPMALGALLGGPFTAISTPPNILVTDALRSAGLAPFQLFDFTPITAVIVLAGTGYVVLMGRRSLPDRSDDRSADPQRELNRSYQLQEYLFTSRIEPGSPLAGRTLRQSRLGSALHLSVLAVQRKEGLNLGPGPEEVLRPGDQLVLHGRPDHLERFRGSAHLRLAPPGTASGLLAGRLNTVEVEVGAESPLVGVSLRESQLRKEYRVHVMELDRGSTKHTEDLPRLRIEAGDRLRLCGESGSLKAVVEAGLADFISAQAELTDSASLVGPGSLSLRAVRVPADSILAQRDLASSRLGSALGLTVVGIAREGELLLLPSPEESVRPDDLLLVLGTPGDLEILQGLQDLQIRPQTAAQLAELESQEVAVTEILLSPRTGLVGRSLSDLRFRERYGLTVLAVWREGRPRRSNLGELRLQFGDALLVYGYRRNLEAVARDPDFLVLDPTAIQAPRLDKAPWAVGILAAVLASAMLGWAPISIAALAGSALVVLAGCISMDEAYRAIEWKVVFLIAGMLPLGAAIEGSGVAQMGSEALIGVVGDFGPRAVVAVLFLVTVLATQVIPTAALVVLMAPVALGASASLDISPHLLMMTVAMAASSSFASPVSHPAHLLVMGPGGYRFVDYVKVGGPVTVVAFVVVVLLLPILWPP